MVFTDGLRIVTRANTEEGCYEKALHIKEDDGTTKVAVKFYSEKAWVFLSADLYRVLSSGSRFLHRNDPVLSFGKCTFFITIKGQTFPIAKLVDPRAVAIFLVYGLRETD